MALVITKIFDLYRYMNDEISDPRTRDMIFMSNPFSMFTILGVYLLVILKWGPAFMKHRQPYKLDWLIAIYNVVQIIACVYLVRLCLTHAYKRNGYNILCEPIDYGLTEKGLVAAGGSHFYFLIKVLDLLDTVFFVLRKKDKQITFLHLYHHTGMVVLTWNATKFLPGGHGVFTGFINSIIHIIMYTYYLVALISPRYKNNLWWKKYITIAQMVQFLMIILHWSALLFQPDCKFPKFTVAVMVPQNLFMLALFGDFYRKTYMGTRKDAPIKTLCRDLQGLSATNIPDVELRKRFIETKESQAKVAATDATSDTINSSPHGIPYERKRIIDNPTINGNFLRDIHYT